MTMNNPIHLSDRCLVRVAGDDARDFLQNVITNDMKHAGAGKLVYSCLLMPQGFVLHDFFIGQDDTGYFLDCETARVDDLLRRFAIFKLRAKVNFSRMDGNVYAGSDGIADPRLATLPSRLYRQETIAAGAVAVYHDICIQQTIPCGSLAITERDTMADVNLDLLNAVAWDKGCFIGQEVAARMYNLSKAKRRIVTVTSETPMAAGTKVFADSKDMGELRQLSSDGLSGLAQLKVAVLAANSPVLQTAAGQPLTLSIPHYLPATA